MLDRIDLHIEVPAVAYQELRGTTEGVSSAGMSARVERAHALQHQRGFYNAHIPPRLLRKLCALDDCRRADPRNARAHDRILKVARTIADLDGQERIAAKHLAEAVQYRSLDRNYWS